MEVKPLRAILIASVFVIIGGIGIMTSMEATRIQGPSDLSLDSLGHLHVRIHQKVFVYDDSGAYQRDYSLADFGIQDIWGGLAFFSNGDVLLAPAELPETDSGLHSPPALRQLNRCDAYSGQCRPLANFEHKFRRSYRAHIDGSDDIFLSDSARGGVFWLTSDGQEIDKLPKQLSKPNEIARDGDTVVVADTESHSLLLIPLGESAFADQTSWQRISTRPFEEDSWKVSQPVDFARTQSGWAVLVKNARMSRSAIRHYDDSGFMTGEVKLQREGYIIALEALGDDLIATDYRNWRVLRFDQQGSRFSELSSPAQENYIEEMRGQAQLLGAASVGAWVLFAILFIVGIVVAVRYELKKANNANTTQANATTESKADTRQPTPSDMGIQWLNPPRFDIAGILLALIVVLALAMIAMIPAMEPNKPCSIGPIMLWMTVLMVAPVVITLVIMRKRVKNTRIGVRDEWVIVRFPDGSIEMSRDRDVLKINNGFIIHNRKVGVGNGRHYLYDKKDIDTLLQPLLAKAGTLGPMDQMAWEWRHNRTTTAALGLAVVLGLALYAVVELGVGKDWLEQKLMAMLGPECQAATEKEAL